MTKNGMRRLLLAGDLSYANVIQKIGDASSDPPGLLLLDTSLRPLYANEEAVSILCFPETQRDGRHLNFLLEQKIDSLIPKQNGSSKLNNEFASGKRCYHIRTFALKRGLGNGLGPTLAVLLERNGRAPLDLSRIRERFRTTQRETEALELLMQGYTTAQIASRMNISSNTAKAFLRSVMIKVGADNRSGILAKILQFSKGVTE